MAGDQVEWIPIHSPIYVVLSVITLAHFGVGSLAYWRRWTLFPISGQAHVLVLTSQVR